MKNESKRGFERVTTYKDQTLTLPRRATQHSAGYDFFASEEIIVPSLLKQIGKEAPITSTLVPTGIKAYMQPDEYLLLANRSSNPLVNQLSMPNGVGIVDADYYGNENNEGEIYFQFINYGPEDHLIKKGDRIGQGLFMPFLKADSEEQVGDSRTGGFGSSGR